ncbi:hypothetical protein GCM10017708_23610 [Arthrobacter citreus]
MPDGPQLAGGARARPAETLHGEEMIKIPGGQQTVNFRHVRVDQGGHGLQRNLRVMCKSHLDP